MCVNVTGGREASSTSEGHKCGRVEKAGLSSEFLFYLRCVISMSFSSAVSSSVVSISSAASSFSTSSDLMDFSVELVWATEVAAPPWFKSNDQLTSIFPCLTCPLWRPEVDKTEVVSSVIGAAVVMTGVVVPTSPLTPLLKFQLKSQVRTFELGERGGGGGLGDVGSAFFGRHLAL